MKKFLGIVVLGLLVSWNANSKDILTIPDGINKLLNDGYKIINESIVSGQDTNKFITVLTLQDRSSSLIICNISFDSSGYFDDFFCIKP